MVVQELALVNCFLLLLTRGRVIGQGQNDTGIFRTETQVTRHVHICSHGYVTFSNEMNCMSVNLILRLHNDFQ